MVQAKHATLAAAAIIEPTVVSAHGTKKMQQASTADVGVLAKVQLAVSYLRQVAAFLTVAYFAYIGKFVFDCHEQYAADPKNIHTYSDGECSRYWVQALLKLPHLVAASSWSAVDLVNSLFFLSYKVVRSDEVVNSLDPQYLESSRVVYEKGPLDVMFILGMMILLTVFQKSLGFAVDKAFEKYSKSDKPSEKKASTEKSAHSVAAKFSEQFYLFLYYSFSLSVGLYVYRWSKLYPMNTLEIWTDYPAYQLPTVIKSYYLISGAFWIQQLLQYAFFTPFAQRRKDHWPMTIHHFVTCCLVFISYSIHVTRGGNFVLVMMDTADIFLTLAKCLKYMGKRFAKVCDATFAAFAVSWFVTRHIIYFIFVWSVVFECPKFCGHIPYDSYYTRKMVADDDWERPGKYFSIGIWSTFLSLLTILQALLLFWFSLIVKLVIKVLSGSEVEDEREDD